MDKFLEFFYLPWYYITTPMVRTCPKDGGGETAKRDTGMATVREKETSQTQTYLGGGD
jgi:hypothetical protein